MTQKSQWIVAVIAGFVFLGGAIYSFRVGDEFRFFDEREYYILASNLIHRGIFSMDGETSTTYRPPGYPLLLAVPLALNADVVVLKLVNYAALCASIYLIYLILARLTNRLTGVIGALLFALYPLPFFTASTLYPQTMGGFFLVLALYALIRLPARGVTYVLIGLMSGFLTLMIPTGAFVIGLVCLWWLFSNTSHRWQAILTMGITATLMIGIWSYRNYRLYDRFIFISSNSGLNLLYGNMPETTPSSGVSLDISAYTAQTEDMNEAERDDYYKSVALDFIQQDPVGALERYALKTLYYFSYSNTLATEGQTSSANDVIMLLSYGPLLLLFIARLWFIRRIPMTRYEVLSVLIYIASAFFHGIFFTRIRFRVPFEPLLVISDAILLGYVIAALSRALPERHPESAELQTDQ